jgi:sugar phosphate isomerase/epimerase
VVTTLAEAVSAVRKVTSPAAGTIFDTHNTAGESEGPRELLRRDREHEAHVRVNERDGKHRGAGGYDFRPLLRAVRETRCRGWISVEVFDSSPGGRTTAQESRRYLRRIEAQVAAER